MPRDDRRARGVGEPELDPAELRRAAAAALRRAASARAECEALRRRLPETLAQARRLCEEARQLRDVVGNGR
jgi:hypothetical protein